MAENDENFRQEAREEDLEGALNLLLAEEAQLVHKLRKQYSFTRKRKGQALAQAWERIQQARQPVAAQSRQEAHIASIEHQRDKHERNLYMQEITSGTKKTSKIARFFGTVAAVLVMAVLVGSLALVYSASRASTHVASSKPNTQAGGPTTTVDKPDVPGIYLFNSDKKEAMKLDIHTHALVWSSHPVTMDGVAADKPVFVKGDIVYVVVAGQINTDNYIYAFSALNGSLRWRVAMNQYTVPGMSADPPAPTPSPANHIPGAYYAGMLMSPTVEHGILYVMARNGKLVALDAANGKHLWTYDARATAFVDGTIYACGAPEVSGGLVYGSCHNVIFALNAQTGVVSWTKSINANQIFNDPVVVDGNVYMTSFVESQHHAGTWMNSGVYAYNGKTGALLWQHQVNNWVVDAPTVVDGIVYFGSNDHNIYGLRESDGFQVWRYDTGGVVGHAVVSNGVVYAQQDGIQQGDNTYGAPSLMAIQVSNRQQLWVKKGSWEVDAAQGDVLYIHGIDGFSALNGRGGSVIWNSNEVVTGVSIVP
jgi:outer membrane protein assembly factor BamB